MKFLFYLLVLLLPVQLGRHFWPPFSFIQGIRADYLSPTIYLTDILIFLIFVLWLFRLAGPAARQPHAYPTRLTRRGPPPGAPRLASPAAALRKFCASPRLIFWLPALLIIVNLFFSQSPWASLYGLIKLLEFIFFGFYVAKTVRTRGEVSRIILLLTCGLVLESFLAIWQFINQSSIGGFFWFLGERTFTDQTVGLAQAVFNGALILRPYGTFPHPNVLAGFLVVVMTLISSEFGVRSSEFKRVFFFGAIILGTATLFLTFSRVAILLWLLFSGLYFGKAFLKLKPPSKKFIIYHLSFIIFLIFTFSRLNFSLAEESFTRREELATAAIEMIKGYPLFGVGLNNFLVNLPLFQKTQSTILYLQPVHNIYLLVLAETGIAGLIFVLWVLTKTLQKRKAQLLIPLLGILFLGGFDHYWLTLQQGQLLFTLILGLSWSRIK